MNNEELLTLHKNQLKDKLMLMEACSQAAIMVRAKAKTTSDGLLMAAEEFRKEAADLSGIIGDIEAEIAKNA